MRLRAPVDTALQEAATNSLESFKRDESRLLSLYQENSFQGFQRLILYDIFPNLFLMCYLYSEMEIKLN